MPATRQPLAQLLRELGKIDSVEWIRLHYTFPSAFDDDLIDAIASGTQPNHSGRPCCPKPNMWATSSTTTAAQNSMS